MAIVENGWYAVSSSDVATVAKQDTAMPPPAETLYSLRLLLKGVGGGSSPNWVFESEGDRDEFYKKLVDAMGQ